VVAGLEVGRLSGRLQDRLALLIGQDGIYGELADQRMRQFAGPGITPRRCPLYRHQEFPSPGSVESSAVAGSSRINRSRSIEAGERQRPSSQETNNGVNSASRESRGIWFIKDFADQGDYRTLKRTRRMLARRLRERDNPRRSRSRIRRQRRLRLFSSAS